MAALRLIILLALVGCYDVPQPACGFQCGPSSNRDVCPNGYSCEFGRCVLIGHTGECPAIIDPEVTDRTPPGIQARSPMVDQTGVELDAIVLVTFDEEVSDVDASTFGVSLGGTFVNGAVTSASPGRAFRFVPSRNLQANGTYEVVLGSAITDVAGNRLPETRWSFSTIEDVTGPMLLSSSPANGATGVEPNAAITLSFDEPITSNALTSVRLERAGVPEMITLSLPAPTSISIDHDPLVGDTLYTIVLTDQITDFAGNPFMPTTLTFTTRDTTPPAIVGRVPLPDATGVSTTSAISITFSEALGDQDIYLAQASTMVDTAFTDVTNPDQTYTITLTPTAPLAPATIYTVHVGLVRDNLANAATFPDYAFTTAP
jgi:methionine-rich copper-binding protein CopC